MKIPQKLPQFRSNPALIVTTGDYKTKCYLAFNSNIQLIGDATLTPRDVGMEKQGMVKWSTSRMATGAVSHRERYSLDLRKQFFLHVEELLETVINNHSFDSIYFFAPEHLKNLFLEEVRNIPKNKIKMSFAGEFINYSPIHILQIIQQQQVKPFKPQSSEEAKIIERPITKVRHAERKEHY